MWEFKMQYNKTKKEALELSKKVKMEFGIKNVGPNCNMEDAERYRRGMEQLIYYLINNDVEEPMVRLLKVEGLMVSEYGRRDKFREKECITRFECSEHDRRIDIVFNPIFSLIAAYDVLQSKTFHL